MNCVYEGQSFSVGIMDGELGGREATEKTIETMVAADLVSPGQHGTFVLTRAGAEAVSSMVATKRPSHARSASWQARRPADKPS